MLHLPVALSGGAFVASKANYPLCDVARVALFLPLCCQVDMKSDERKQLGRIMLKGDTITLMQSV